MEIIEKYELAAPVITGIFQVVCLFMLYGLTGRRERKKDIRSVKEEVYASAMHRLFLQKKLLINRSEDKLAQAEAEEAISLNASRILICGSADVYRHYLAISKCMEFTLNEMLSHDLNDPEEKRRIDAIYKIIDEETSRLVLRIKKELHYKNDGWVKRTTSKCPVCNCDVQDHEGCDECGLSYEHRIFFDHLHKLRAQKLKEYEERKESRGLLF